jgi:hypothetical protein
VRPFNRDKLAVRFDPRRAKGKIEGVHRRHDLFAGWRSARRRWLLWLAVVANVYVLINTVLVIAAEAGAS